MDLPQVTKLGRLLPPPPAPVPGSYSSTAGATDYHGNANLTAPQAPTVHVSKLSQDFNLCGPGYPPNLFGFWIYCFQNRLKVKTVINIDMTSNYIRKYCSLPTLAKYIR
eukprot:sb/3477350/